jgi:phosphatidyl-myo-inositol dimannoside synthase
LIGAGVSSLSAPEAGTTGQATPGLALRSGAPVKSLLISGVYFPPQTGGISRYMERLASTLGPTQVCCLTGAVAETVEPFDASRPRVYRRPAIFKGSKGRRAMCWGATLSEIMIRERPRLVQLATAYEGNLGLWLRRWLKLPFVVYAYGNEILDAIQVGAATPRLALQTADRVLAISRFTADLVQKAGVAPDRIEVVYLGCDAHHFRPLPAKIELRQKLLRDRCTDRVILTVGNLVPRKGHDMVIRALPRLRETIPDVTYLIVGEGPNRSQLEVVAEAVGLRDRVIFAGKIPDPELPEIYALSDVFAMPSREHLENCNVEGFGLVFLEANACGKAVVGGRSGGIPDAIEDGVTGFLVNPNDPDDVAGAIARILTDKDLASRMGAQGRARVVNNFTWQTTGARVQEILESVVRERAARN